MSNFFVPDSVFNKLRCHICKGYLSVSPISRSEGRYSCGRCKPFNQTNHIYEELARCGSFPCIYEGCEERVHWNDVVNHEIVCPHKSIICPFLNCSVKLKVTMASTHFRISHQDFRHTNNVEGGELRLRSIYQPLERVHCVDFKGTSYFVFVRLTNRVDGNSVTYVLTVGAFSLTENTNEHVQYDVNLKLQSSIEKSKMAKHRLMIQPFKENVHCYQCLNRECTIRGHRNEGNFLITQFAGIDPSNNMCLTYSVKIYDNTEVTPERLQSPNAGIGAELECPVCRIYMSAPIYNCLEGHSVCGRCTAFIPSCPLCKTPMGMSRNYILEKISETMLIPCHNANEGCQFVGLIKDTVEHEKSC